MRAVLHRLLGTRADVAAQEEREEAKRVRAAAAVPPLRPVHSSGAESGALGSAGAAARNSNRDNKTGSSSDADDSGYESPGVMDAAAVASLASSLRVGVTAGEAAAEAARPAFTTNSFSGDAGQTQEDDAAAEHDDDAVDDFLQNVIAGKTDQLRKQLAREKLEAAAAAAAARSSSDAAGHNVAGGDGGGGGRSSALTSFAGAGNTATSTPTASFFASGNSTNAPTAAPSSHPMPSHGGSAAAANAAAHHAQHRRRYVSSAARSLQDYELIAFLGSGTFAEVTLARNKVTQEYFAVKKISKQRVKEEGCVERTFTERQLLANLHHPFLVRLYQAFQSQTHLYLVLDFAQGGDLFYLNMQQLWLRSMRRVLVKMQYPYYQSTSSTFNAVPGSNAARMAGGSTRLTPPPLSHSSRSISPTAAHHGSGSVQHHHHHHHQQQGAHGNRGVRSGSAHAGLATPLLASPQAGRPPLPPLSPFTHTNDPEGSQRSPAVTGSAEQQSSTRTLPSSASGGSSSGCGGATSFTTTLTMTGVAQRAAPVANNAASSVRTHADDDDDDDESEFDLTDINTSMAGSPGRVDGAGSATHTAGQPPRRRRAADLRYYTTDAVDEFSPVATRGGATAAARRPNNLGNEEGDAETQDEDAHHHQQQQKQHVSGVQSGGEEPSASTAPANAATTAPSSATSAASGSATLRYRRRRPNRSTGDSSAVDDDDDDDDDDAGRSSGGDRVDGPPRNARRRSSRGTSGAGSTAAAAAAAAATTAAARLPPSLSSTTTARRRRSANAGGSGSAVEASGNSFSSHAVTTAAGTPDLPLSPLITAFLQPAAVRAGEVTGEDSRKASRDGEDASAAAPPQTSGGATTPAAAPSSASTQEKKAKAKKKGQRGEGAAEKPRKAKKSKGCKTPTAAPAEEGSGSPLGDAAGSTSTPASSKRAKKRATKEGAAQHHAGSFNSSSDVADAGRAAANFFSSVPDASTAAGAAVGDGGLASMSFAASAGASPAQEAAAAAAAAHVDLSAPFHQVGMENSTTAMRGLPADTFAADDSHRFPLRLVAFYAVEVALVLQYLHGEGFLYRDLKPENILMRGDGHVMLTDFGVAKYRKGAAIATAAGLAGSTNTNNNSSATGGAAGAAEAGVAKAGDDLAGNPAATTDGKANSFTGTTQYMSPEMLRGLPHDSRTDWWSYGCLLFEWANGRKAFDGANQFSLFRAIVEEDVRVTPADYRLTPLEVHTRVAQLHYRSEELRLEYEDRAARRMRRSGLQLPPHSPKYTPAPLSAEVVYNRDSHSFDVRLLTTPVTPGPRHDDHGDTNAYALNPSRGKEDGASPPHAAAAQQQQQLLQPSSPTSSFPHSPGGAAAAAAAAASAASSLPSGVRSCSDKGGTALHTQRRMSGRPHSGANTAAVAALLNDSFASQHGLPLGGDAEEGVYTPQLTHLQQQQQQQQQQHFGDSFNNASFASVAHNSIFSLGGTPSNLSLRLTTTEDGGIAALVSSASPALLRRQQQQRERERQRQTRRRRSRLSCLAIDPEARDRYLDDAVQQMEEAQALLKDLTLKLLDRTVEQRLSGDAVLEHPFFTCPYVVSQLYYRVYQQRHLLPELRRSTASTNANSFAGMANSMRFDEGSLRGGSLSTASASFSSPMGGGASRRGGDSHCASFISLPSQQRPEDWRDLFLERRIRALYAPHLRTRDDLRYFPAAVTATGLSAAVEQHRRIKEVKEQQKELLRVSKAATLHGAAASGSGGGNHTANHSVVSSNNSITGTLSAAHSQLGAALQAAGDAVVVVPMDAEAALQMQQLLAASSNSEHSLVKPQDVEYDAAGRSSATAIGNDSFIPAVDHIEHSTNDSRSSDGATAVVAPVDEDAVATAAHPLTASNTTGSAAAPTLASTSAAKVHVVADLVSADPPQAAGDGRRRARTPENEESDDGEEDKPSRGDVVRLVRTAHGTPTNMTTVAPTTVAREKINGGGGPLSGDLAAAEGSSGGDSSSAPSPAAAAVVDSSAVDGTLTSLNSGTPSSSLRRELGHDKIGSDSGSDGSSSFASSRADRTTTTATAAAAMGTTPATAAATDGESTTTSANEMKSTSQPSPSQLFDRAATLPQSFVDAALAVAAAAQKKLQQQQQQQQQQQSITAANSAASPLLPAHAEGNSSHDNTTAPSSPLLLRRASTAPLEGRVASTDAFLVPASAANSALETGEAGGEDLSAASATTASPTVADTTGATTQAFAADPQAEVGGVSSSVGGAPHKSVTLDSAAGPADVGLHASPRHDDATDKLNEEGETSTEDDVGGGGGYYEQDALAEEPHAESLDGDGDVSAEMDGDSGNSTTRSESMRLHRALDDPLMSPDTSFEERALTSANPLSPGSAPSDMMSSSLLNSRRVSTVSQIEGDALQGRGGEGGRHGLPVVVPVSSLSQARAGVTPPRSRSPVNAAGGGHGAAAGEDEDDGEETWGGRTDGAATSAAAAASASRDPGNDTVPHIDRSRATTFALSEPTSGSNSSRSMKPSIYDSSLTTTAATTPPQATDSSYGGSHPHYPVASMNDSGGCHTSTSETPLPGVFHGGQPLSAVASAAYAPLGTTTAMMSSTHVTTTPPSSAPSSGGTTPFATTMGTMTTMPDLARSAAQEVMSGAEGPDTDHSATDGSTPAPSPTPEDALAATVVSHSEPAGASAAGETPGEADAGVVIDGAVAHAMASAAAAEGDDNDDGVADERGYETSGGSESDDSSDETSSSSSCESEEEETEEEEEEEGDVGDARQHLQRHSPSTRGGATFAVGVHDRDDGDLVRTASSSASSSSMLGSADSSISATTSSPSRSLSQVSSASSAMQRDGAVEDVEGYHTSRSTTQERDRSVSAGTTRGPHASNDAAAGAASPSSAGYGGRGAGGTGDDFELWTGAALHGTPPPMGSVPPHVAAVPGVNIATFPPTRLSRRYGGGVAGSPGQQQQQQPSLAASMNASAMGGPWASQDALADTRYFGDTMIMNPELMGRPDFFGPLTTLPGVAYNLDEDTSGSTSVAGTPLADSEASPALLVGPTFTSKSAAAAASGAVPTSSSNIVVGGGGPAGNAARDAKARWAQQQRQRINRELQQRQTGGPSPSPPPFPQQQQQQQQRLQQEGNVSTPSTPSDESTKTSPLSGNAQQSTSLNRQRPLAAAAAAPSPSSALSRGGGGVSSNNEFLGFTFNDVGAGAMLRRSRGGAEDSFDPFRSDNHNSTPANTGSGNGGGEGRRGRTGRSIGGGGAGGGGGGVEATHAAANSGYPPLPDFLDSHGEQGHGQLDRSDDDDGNGDRRAARRHSSGSNLSGSGGNVGGGSGNSGSGSAGGLGDNFGLAAGLGGAGGGFDHFQNFSFTSPQILQQYLASTNGAPHSDGGEGRPLYGQRPRR